MKIHGNYDTSSLRNFMIVFEKCDPEKRKCKSDQEITDWLEYKYIYTI